jgi:hypothetical protein
MTTSIECKHEWAPHRIVGGWQRCANCGEDRDAEAETNPNTPAPRVEADALLDAAREAFEALDVALGDTDPSIDDEATDEDVRNEHPVFWAAQRLSKAIADYTGAASHESPKDRAQPARAEGEAVVTVYKAPIHHGTYNVSFEPRNWEHALPFGPTKLYTAPQPASQAVSAEPRNLFAPGDTVRHRNGSEYVVLFRADYEPAMTDCYVYRGEDGHTWVRPALVMEDGRFTLVKRGTAPASRETATAQEATVSDDDEWRETAEILFNAVEKLYQGAEKG